MSSTKKKQRHLRHLCAKKKQFSENHIGARTDTYGFSGQKCRERLLVVLYSLNIVRQQRRLEPARAQTW
jgi:hypothetical protein